MQRRTLLKLGLVSGTVLALAGGAAMLVQPGLVQRRLTDAGRALFIGVGRAILQGTLPPDPAEQRQALEGMADRVDILAQNLPLFDIGFGWVVPCFGGIAVGLLLKAVRKAN